MMLIMIAIGALSLMMEPTQSTDESDDSSNDHTFPPWIYVTECHYNCVNGYFKLDYIGICNGAVYVPHDWYTGKPGKYGRCQDCRARGRNPEDGKCQKCRGQWKDGKN